MRGVVDVSRKRDRGKGTIFGVTVKDGTIVARVQMAGRGQRFLRPLIHDDVLYIPSCQDDEGPSELEAYAISAFLQMPEWVY